MTTPDPTIYGNAMVSLPPPPRTCPVCRKTIEGDELVKMDIMGVCWCLSCCKDQDLRAIDREIKACHEHIVVLQARRAEREARP
jgi:hypothetical protein